MKLVALWVVPSCSVCNLKKLDEQDDFFNPHVDVNSDDVFTFELKVKEADFIVNPDSFDLEIDYNKLSPFLDEIKKTIDQIDLKERYSIQKAKIQDLLNKKMMFSDNYIASMKNLPYLKSVPADIIKGTIFESCFDYRDYYKRPFSKLSNDILS